jgi:tetratricopeptide (TPR) repeat protein
MSSDSRTRCLRDAEKYVLQGKINQAIAEYLKITRAEPDDVLILNTIGDLYLRQGKIADANKLFYQVAEHYIRDNFLMKAIAVYKKILASDPSNLELNSTIASLYARQGMNVDAKIQFLHVAEMCAMQGQARECLEAYEKVIELDPMNSAVQLKLAAAHRAGGNTAKANLHLLGAARAQTKAGDLAGAMRSYQQALDADSHNTDILRGLLETGLQLGEVAPVLEKLSLAVSQVPQDVDLRELLGRAFLAANDPDSALGHFEIVLSEDDTRVENIFVVSRTLLDSGDPDRAAQSLEPIVPLLIGRRETERLVEALNLILDHSPAHVPSLKKLADIFAAVNDEGKHLNALDRLVDYFAAGNEPAEALPYLERILEISPDSDPHLRMHRDIFTRVHPGVPYISPVTGAPESSRDARGAPEGALSPGDAGGGVGAALIEIDLLLNYGMKEKALQHLLQLVAQDPFEKQVRARLAAVYTEMENHREAAQHCLLGAALELRSGQNDAADKLLAQAKNLAPDMVGENFDLATFAEKNGIRIGETKYRGHASARGQARGVELDLTGDLSDIFFRNGGTGVDLDDMESEGLDLSAGVEEIPATVPTPSPVSVAEQLQEADFYIRLGFHDEAKAKLAEISKEHPGHPELASRYQQLGEPFAETCAGPEQPASGAATQPEHLRTEDTEAPQLLALGPGPESAAETVPPAAAVAREADLESAWDGHPGEVPPLASELPRRGAAPRAPSAENAQEKPAGIDALCEEAGINQMFADLIQEVNSLTEQEIAREDYETHFSLGIAYREMNLTDEAIREFQGAVKALNPARSPHEAVQCCGMLSTCFLDKGMARSALRWCQTGLSLPDISAHEEMALQYDMGVAHTLAGEHEHALECFKKIFVADPTYRDVAQRIDGLKSDHVQHAPPDLT